MRFYNLSLENCMSNCASRGYYCTARAYWSAHVRLVSFYALSYTRVEQRMGNCFLTCTI